MLKNKEIAVIGVGKMGGMLSSALLKKGVVNPDQLCGTTRHPDTAERARAEYGLEMTTDNAAAAAGRDVVLLAVKPQVQLPHVLNGVDEEPCAEDQDEGEGELGDHAGLAHPPPVNGLAASAAGAAQDCPDLQRGGSKSGGQAGQEAGGQSEENGEEQHPAVQAQAGHVDLRVGEGTIVLFAFRPQHRAQAWGTFKLLFNAIQLATAEGGRSDEIAPDPDASGPFRRLFRSLH